MCCIHFSGKFSWTLRVKKRRIDQEQAYAHDQIGMGHPGSSIMDHMTSMGHVMGHDNILSQLPHELETYEPNELV
jgi:hypothetical protein